MIDSKLIEEIVNKVMARLMEDPAFMAASRAGYFQSANSFFAPENNPGTGSGNGLQSQPLGQRLQASPQGQGSSYPAPQFLSTLNQKAPVAAPPLNTNVPTHHGRVLSEWDILQIHRSGKRAVNVAKSVIITPLAKDRARDLSVEILRG